MINQKIQRLAIQDILYTQQEIGTENGHTVEKSVEPVLDGEGTPEHLDRPLARFDETLDQPEQGRLPGPTRADQSDALPWIDGKFIDSQDLLALGRDPDIAQVDDRFGTHSMIPCFLAISSTGR